MIERYVDKNKYGGYTWTIEINPEFKIEIQSTQKGNFVVNFIEAKWIRYKTIFSMISDEDFVDTIKSSCRKMLNHMQTLKRYDINEFHIEITINKALTEIYNSTDSIDKMFLKPIIEGLYPITGMTLTSFNAITQESEERELKDIIGELLVSTEEIILKEVGDENECTYKIISKPVYIDKKNIHDQNYTQVDVLTDIDGVENIFKFVFISNIISENIWITPTKPINNELIIIKLILGN
jgi:hypothetical protein